MDISNRTVFIAGGTTGIGAGLARRLAAAGSTVVVGGRSAARVNDVDAVVIPRGLLSTSLLGMSFLRRLRDFGVSGSTMTLRG